MYYQNYEDYMKNVLGARYTPEYNQVQNYPYNYIPTYTMPMNMPNTNASMQEYNSIPVANNNTMQMQTPKQDTVNVQEVNSEAVSKMKKMYPEIHRLLTPMIEKTIAENKEKEVTEELIETMTKQIYDAIEDDVSVRQVSTQSIASNDNKNRNMNINSQVQPVVNNQRVNRRQSNTTLRDLIKILLINSLINNLRPNRPRENQRPMQMQGMRPPMPRDAYQAMSYFNVPYPEDEYIG